MASCRSPLHEELVACSLWINAWCELLEACSEILEAGYFGMPAGWEVEAGWEERPHGWGSATMILEAASGGVVTSERRATGKARRVSHGKKNPRKKMPRIKTGCRPIFDVLEVNNGVLLEMIFLFLPILILGVGKHYDLRNKK